LFFSKKSTVSQRIIPKHIGIVMDGNGRWASKRKLPRTAGHTVGASNFRTITKYASKIGVKYLTMYAFSTENWKRPSEEVGSLMKLFKQYLQEALQDFTEENIKVNFIGDVSKFPPDLQSLIHEVEAESASKTGMVLNLAMNYGGRAEIVHAIQSIAEDIKCGNTKIDDIDESLVSSKLYTTGQPDPELIIRPSGEQRISNFLIWQSAYSEFVYFDILWPDFKTKDLDNAIDIFSSRNRRFGGI